MIGIKLHGAARVHALSERLPTMERRPAMAFITAASSCDEKGVRNRVMQRDACRNPSGEADRYGIHDDGAAKTGFGVAAMVGDGLSCVPAQLSSPAQRGGRALHGSK